MRGEVYPGIYQLGDDGPVRTFVAETVVKAQACVDEWAQQYAGDQLVLTGDGLKKYRSLFEEAGFADVRVYGDRRMQPPAEGEQRIFLSAQRPNEPENKGEPNA